MSEGYFDSALNSLKKPQELERLEKILAVVRKEVEWPDKKVNIYKVRDKGCLKSIVDCLLHRQVNILNRTLSILGNMCMIREVARELVNEYNLLNNISAVLKRNPHDSIRGRIFRILGNLCRHHDYHGSIIINKNPQLQIVTNVTSFLKLVCQPKEANTVSTNDPDTDDNSWSDATICMAIRTLRELVTIESVTKLVEEYEVIKAIGMVIIKFTPIWLNTGQHEDILQGVLKLLNEYSVPRNVNLIVELQNTGNGNAMNWLGKLLFLSPYVLVKVVMNLLKISNLRSDLPIVDMSENLIRKLENVANFTAGREDLRHREYLKCLCFLMHHPANKEDLRLVGLIPALILILKDFDEETEISIKNCILIISNLRICMYDEASLLEMLKYDIINVLISKLNWAVGVNSCFDLTHAYRCDSSSRKRRKLTTYKCFMHKLMSDGLGFPCCSIRNDVPCNYITSGRSRSISPSSDISISSGPSSPSNPILSNEEDSDDYSPVCSDVEENKSLQDPPAEDEDMIYKPSPYYEEPDIEKSQTGTTKENVQNSKWRLYSLCTEIMKLIKLFCKLRPAVMELVTTDLLVKLLNFLVPKHANICPPDTLAIILMVVETHEYLLKLMQTDFIIATYKLSVMIHESSCDICQNMSAIARAIIYRFTIVVESGSGKGDIAHQLHRANISIKQGLVFAIPFVTSNKFILIKLMIDCGGLNILVQSFQDCCSTQWKCITSLCVLALKLEIKNPVLVLDEHAVFMPIVIENYELNSDCSSSVCFKLDDGSCVLADRNFLCEKSEYFKCLLSGMFKESGENEVALHNVPNKALKLLLMLLQYDVNNVEIYKIDADLDILLDVIALSESYLLSDLCNCLTLTIQYFKLQPSTIPRIYQWSIESGTDILRVESVAYALVAEMKDCERDSMFSNLLGLGYTDKIADDIKKLLTRFLVTTKFL